MREVAGGKGWGGGAVLVDVTVKKGEGGRGVRVKKVKCPRGPCELKAADAM